MLEEIVSARVFSRGDVSELFTIAPRRNIFSRVAENRSSESRSSTSTSGPFHKENTMEETLPMRLIDRIEELDDVQEVFTNADFPEAALDEYGA